MFFLSETHNKLNMMGLGSNDTGYDWTFTTKHTFCVISEVGMWTTKKVT